MYEVFYIYLVLTVVVQSLYPRLEAACLENQYKNVCIDLTD